MNLIEFIFGTYEDTDYDLRRYVEALDIRTTYVKLEGPFLDEEYALKYIDVYKELLQKTYYRINMSVNRRIALISKDDTLETIDNVRVKASIYPFNHKFELCRLSAKDFTVVAVDGNILLNGNDARNIRESMKMFPITLREENQYPNQSDQEVLRRAYLGRGS